jgi:GntR family transcriptional regulator
MIRALHVDPASSTPIWSQIEEGVRRLVAGGALPPGEAVPSVRDLARELRVNPATVSKAYQRLAEARILTVRRGEGTFVSDSAPEMGRIERGRTLREGATRFASLAITIGATQDEASEKLRAVWREFGDGMRRGEKR